MLFLRRKRHPQWRVSLHARAAQGFDFRLTFSKILLTPAAWGRAAGARFSLLLRVRNFIVRVRSSEDGGVLVSCEDGRKKTLKSRVSQTVKSIFRRLTPAERCVGNELLLAVAGESSELHRNPAIGALRRLPAIEAAPPGRDGGSIACRHTMQGMTGALSFLSHSASRRDHTGIIVHSLTTFFYLVWLLKTSSTRKRHSYLCMVAVLVSFLGFFLAYLRLVVQLPEVAWMVWFNVLALGCFCTSTQFKGILSRISLAFESNMLGGVFILASLPLLFFGLGQESLLKGLKIVADGLPTLVIGILMLFRTLSHRIGNFRDPKRLAIFISSSYFFMNEMTMLWPLILKLHYADMGLEYIYFGDSALRT